MQPTPLDGLPKQRVSGEPWQRGATLPKPIAVRKIGAQRPDVIRRIRIGPAKGKR